ncbi:MAG: SMC-Scp complex subunit ScpB [Propionibacteriaceae bacterium]|jgi:segregation and condensation protein B|nr:SMC-Scp complex subunit ScpB [Propionibacteriaceae bacterium]
MTDIEPQLEALLLLATEPLPVAELAAAVQAPEAAVDEALTGLARFYTETGRGFELRRVGAGWRYYTREEYADTISRWLLEEQSTRLSPAALETLAVVAYLQPISRSRVSALRGVNVDAVMRTLTAREMVEVAGVDEATGANLYATTALFLEKMGLTSLDELPPIAPYLPDATALEAELAGLAQQPAPAAAGEGSPEPDSEPELGAGESQPS